MENLGNKMISFLLFVYLVNTVVGTSQESPVTKSLVFQQLTITGGRGGPVRIGETWISDSVASCVSTSMTRFLTCLSVMYNSETGLCTPGVNLTDTEASPTATEGKLYVSYDCGTLCGPFPQFQRYTNGDTSACLALFRELKSYADAHVLCSNLSSSLFSPKTVEKRDILNQLETSQVWIGLDSLQEMGIFRWKVDGTEFDMLMKTDYFIFGQPIPWVSKTCVSVLDIWNWKGAGLNCKFSYSFVVCEKPL